MTKVLHKNVINVLKSYHSEKLLIDQNIKQKHIQEKVYF